MIRVHNSPIFIEEVKMSNSNNDNHVFPNEGDNLEMETNNTIVKRIDDEENCIDHCFPGVTRFDGVIGYGNFQKKHGFPPFLGFSSYFSLRYQGIDWRVYVG